MTAPHQSRSPDYGIRVAHVTRLLRAALQSGEKGMREGDPCDVRKCSSSMMRAYESALKYSLNISLTKQHCASIDEKSHRIEVLRPKLEKRIADLDRSVRHTAARGANKREPGFVELFVKNCRVFQEQAMTMREMNAALMRRSESFCVHAIHPNDSALRR